MSDEVGRDLERRLLARELVQAKGEIAGGEHLQDLGQEPGGIVELERVAVRRRAGGSASMKSRGGRGPAKPTGQLDSRPPRLSASDATRSNKTPALP